MEENKEMNLVAKRAKLIEYQNQISWIVCEYEKMKNVKYRDKWFKAKAVVLYENLNTIVEQINEESLDCYINCEYARTINGILDDLKFYTEVSKRVSETNIL
ncbi:MAG: hypothetical protein IJ415_01290 [Clostridia bacterium]|nr:hypothetical protein [Clostridia bacterium]